MTRTFASRIAALAVVAAVALTGCSTTPAREDRPTIVPAQPAVAPEPATPPAGLVAPAAAGEGLAFDTVGRRPMIAFTYAISAVLLAGAGYLFKIEVFGPVGQTAVWMVVFFFASAAASSAYLTVSETFPLEIRALAIAAFFSLCGAAVAAQAPGVDDQALEPGMQLGRAAGEVQRGDFGRGLQHGQQLLARRLIVPLAVGLDDGQQIVDRALEVAGRALGLG